MFFCLKIFLFQIIFNCFTKYFLQASLRSLMLHDNILDMSEAAVGLLQQLVDSSVKFSISNNPVSCTCSGARALDFYLERAADTRAMTRRCSYGVLSVHPAAAEVVSVAGV